MRSQGELWEALGEVEEEETGHVLTRLFVSYESMLTNDKESEEAQRFFKRLDNALAQTEECNLNRR